MSRTDKDMPDYARATWWEPYHYGCGTPGNGLWWWQEYLGQVDYRMCDLPQRPVREFQQWRRPPRCHWTPIDDRDYDRASPYYFQRYYFRARPSREQRRVYYWGPHRRAARDGLRLAIAQHRGSGEVEVEVDLSQHRHGVAAHF